MADEARRWSAARALGVVVVSAGVVVAVAVALPVLGALIPALPFFGVLGPQLVGRWAFRFVLLGIVLASVAAVGWWLRVRRAASALGGAALIALAGSLVVLGGQLSFAHERGVPVGFADVLGAATPTAPPDRTEVFAEVGGHELRASVWSPPRAGAARPAVVWVHGGGFSAGSRFEQRALYRYLADRGYPVISIDYRLAPPPRWRDATSDVVCALSWITEHAAELGVDPSRLVLSGGSAGGGLAINAGYALAARDDVGGCGGVRPAPPIAVAGFYPAVDLAGAYADAGLGGYGRRTAVAYLGGSPERFPERYVHASAVARVRPGLMPTLLVTGVDDHLILEKRVRGFADRLRAEGDVVDYVAVPFGDHAFDSRFHTTGGAVSRAELLRFLRAHVPPG
ncbi:alpha/beta hydrolase [Saccharopolyspora sp. NFXS83]|uniref:alpha/beta hydrolase n=1 Tax=Saccharopolyspora sp. NFXS83 TaxID=2993560 RepID=UPI00224A7EA7|nr:alpha/beta hydrolase [Saccharopolyspora sp. NFXS83]MCX2732709.1 alpha/beta hydrolase [Saccharopolyspora sp. NFXS83]